MVFWKKSEKVVTQTVSEQLEGVLYSKDKHWTEPNKDLFFFLL